GAPCLAVHGARFLYRYFSADRTRMTCLFEAPDAESVRLAQGSARIPYDRVWTARLVSHAMGEPEGDVVFVERTLPESVDEEGLREAAARAAECLDRQGCRILRSYLSVDGRRAACVFTCPDAESVRGAALLQGPRRAAAPPVAGPGPPALRPRLAGDRIRRAPRRRARDPRGAGRRPLNLAPRAAPSRFHVG